MSFFEKIEELDQSLLLWINEHHSLFFDDVMWSISSKWFGIPFYLLVSVLLFRKFGFKNAFLALLVIGASIGLADLISTELFKNLIQRYRPTHHLELKDQLHIVNEYRGGMYGFVSSHSANMFAFAVASLLFLRKRWVSILLISFAILVAYSRVYLGVHYPLDVCVGADLGAVIGLVLYYFSNKYYFSKQ